LIEAGLTEAAAQGWEAVFVLGDPAYYGRFGFAAAPASSSWCRCLSGRGGSITPPPSTG
jgi:putative acetyltransferase